MPGQRSQNRERMETERHDGLSDGAPATAQAEAGQERKANGTLAKGATTTPSKGGKAHKGRTRLTHDVGPLPVTEKLKRRAKFMRKRTCGELADTVGAGYCGILASAFVKLGSEDMALREAALGEGQVDLARKLGESARSHLLYAREVAAKDGQARHRPPTDPLARFMPKSDS